MGVQTFISAKEAAIQLNVHARTIRNWIDTFKEYICPNYNEKGHYVLTEESLERLVDIKGRLQDSSKSLREIKEELIQERKIRDIHSTTFVSDQEYQITHCIENISHMMEELSDRIERLEDRMYILTDSFGEIEHMLVSARNHSVSPREIHHMFDELGKKQDQIKIQLKSIGFTHRLTSATSEQVISPRRQKRPRLFGLF